MILVKRIVNLAIASVCGYGAMRFVLWSKMPWQMWVMMLVTWFAYCALNGWFDQPQPTNHSRTDSFFESPERPAQSEPLQ